MKYVIITKHAKFVVSEAEKDDFMSRYKDMKGNLIRIKGQLVDKFGIEVFELPFFIKQEADSLKLKNLRRCRQCGEILPRSEVCGCKDDPKLREGNEFVIDEPKKLLTLPPM